MATSFAVLSLNAVQRDTLHLRHSGRLTDNPYRELMGLLGEAMNDELFGCGIDLSLKPGGDGGLDAKRPVTLIGNDFAAHPYWLQSKAAYWPKYLLVEPQYAHKADIFVLYQFFDQPPRVVPVGWAWQREVLAAPIGDKGGFGLQCHYIRAGKCRGPSPTVSDLAGEHQERENELHPMSDLLWRRELHYPWPDALARLDHSAAA